MTNTTDKAREQVTAMQALLLTDGWCQGKYHDEDGRHCLEGAYDEANADTATFAVMYDVATAYGSGSITKINDHVLTSVDDAVLFLDACLDALDSEDALMTDDDEFTWQHAYDYAWNQYLTSDDCEDYANWYTEQWPDEDGWCPNHSNPNAFPLWYETICGRS